MKEQHLRFCCQWLSVLVCLIVSNFSFSQNSIKVVDQSDVPLIGVYVSYNDSTLSTDNNGNCFFSEKPADNSDLTFTYIGFEDITISYIEIANAGFKVKMIPDDLLLEEVVIVGRTNAREIELPYHVERISSDKIISSNIQNSADAVKINGGAFVQKSQMGGGSPTLRGFEANKILLVVDGIRMNNAIYRNGHLQNAITIDPNILEQVEVIFGAGSLLYGSEALGGVIHYRTKTPVLNLNENRERKEEVNSFFRYNSSNQEKRFHIDHQLGTKKFGVLTSLTYVDYDDLRTGSVRSDKYPVFGLRPEYVESIDGEDFVRTNNNPNIQLGTGYSQYDIYQKWVYQFSDKFKTELNIQFSNSSDIPRYDNLSEYRNGELRFAEWYYGPQKRVLISPKITWSYSSPIFDKMTFIGSFQDIKEDRISRSLNSRAQENQNENVKVWGSTIDFYKRINSRHKLNYGVDLHYNSVSSVAFEVIDPHLEVPSEVSNILTRYPSGESSLTNFGVFIQHNWQNKDSSLIWINGLRWTNQNVNLSYSRSDPFEWPEYFYDGVENISQSFVGISGLNWINGHWIFKASTGNSFRAPNVDDLAKIRVNRDEITVPNPNLKAETVWNNELTIEYQKKKMAIGITGYYTFLQDAIVRQNFMLPNGENTFINNQDTLTVTGNVNASSGYIRGLSVRATADLNKNWSISSQINFQKGVSENDEGESSPLGHIPPTFGRTSISYTKNKLFGSFDWEYNGWKRIEDFGGSVDNPDLTTPDGAPSWNNLGFHLGYNINSKITIRGSIDNILDHHFRPFASGLSAPGRHVVLSISYSPVDK